MVLAQQVGKKRSFARGLLLSIFTFGIYSVYYNYKVHNEVYRQFELGREDRDEGMVWYVLGLVVPPFLLAYLWVMASNVAYVRNRIGLARGFTPGRFVGRIGVGVGALVVGLIALEVSLLATAPETPEPAEPAPEDAEPVIDPTLAGAVVALALVALGLVGWAYRDLQNAINEVWDAYDARIRYLSQPRPEPAAEAAAPVPPFVRVEAPDVARRLRESLDALVSVHPALAVPEELPQLLELAEAGDEDAARRAEERVAALARGAQDHSQLLRFRDEVDRKLARLAGRLADGELDGATFAGARASLEAEREWIERRLGSLDAELFRPRA